MDLQILLEEEKQKSPREKVAKSHCSFSLDGSDYWLDELKNLTLGFLSYLLVLDVTIHQAVQDSAFTPIWTFLDWHWPPISKKFLLSLPTHFRTSFYSFLFSTALESGAFWKWAVWYYLEWDACCAYLSLHIALQPKPVCLPLQPLFLYGVLLA